MKKLLLTILLTIGLDVNASCPGMAPNDFLPVTREPVTILCKTRFAIGYSETRKGPLWTSEKLTRTQVAAVDVARVDAFKPDPSLPTTVQASLQEYSGTPYDRGHMVPFEDIGDEPQAAIESFYLTNIVPQVASQNRQIWRSLETKARKLATQYGTVYIMTGPIYGTKTLVSGTNIPASLWKVVFVPSAKSAYTVIIPNADGLTAADLPKFESVLTRLKISNMHILNLTNQNWVDKPISSVH